MLVEWMGIGCFLQMGYVHLGQDQSLSPGNFNHSKIWGAVMKFQKALIVCLAVFALSGCANRSVNDVSVGDSGQAYKVKFGTVIAQKPVRAFPAPDESFRFFRIG